MEKLKLDKTFIAKYSGTLDIESVQNSPELVSIFNLVDTNKDKKINEIEVGQFLNDIFDFGADKNTNLELEEGEITTYIEENRNIFFELNIKTADVFKFLDTFITSSKKSEENTDSISDKYMRVKDNSVFAFGRKSIINKILNKKVVKDGVIGTSIQGGTGDCWLLSAINSLSYTEKGRQLIKDALEYKKGGTLVHLKGIGDYFIPDELVSKVKKSYKYSGGDDDMVIFELAMEGVREDLANGMIMCRHVCYDRKDENKTESAVNAGNPYEFYYCISGKNTVAGISYERKKEMLQEYEKNKNYDLAMSTSTSKDVEINDISGKNVSISSPHAYAIKNVSENVVTITNPWNSGEDIKLDIETFLENFDIIESIDLSENNPVKNETMYSKIFQLDNGMTRYEFKNSAGEISKVTIRDSKGEVIYEYLKPDYDNGWTVTEKISDNLEKETSLTYYDDYISYYQSTYNNSEERESLQINRDLEGNVISKIIHSGNKTIINHYEPDGNITTDTYDWQ